MSWQWQRLWWRHHEPLLHADLYLLAAYSADGTLIGLAPMMFRRVRHRGGMRAMRLETIGSTWRCGTIVFSEYLDFIVDRAHVDRVLQAFEAVLAEDRQWDDLVIGHTRRAGVAQRLVESYLGRRTYVRVTDPLEAHVTTIPERFDDYLQALDAGIRRKVWNQRKKLVQPQLTFAGSGEIGEYLDLIDSFHEVRWGSRLYQGMLRKFHLEFAAAMASTESLRLSRLTVGQQPISVMYNIRLGNKEYNLQSGFDLRKATGMSPGYLHFGYSLENACADGIRQFDFLAGQGRARQYKQDFNTRGEEIVCTQLVRSRALGWIYRLYDLSKGVRAHAAPRAAELATGGSAGG